MGKRSKAERKHQTRSMERQERLDRIEDLVKAGDWKRATSALHTLEQPRRSWWRRLFGL